MPLPPMQCRACSLENHVLCCRNDFISLVQFSSPFIVLWCSLRLVDLKDPPVATPRHSGKVAEPGEEPAAERRAFSYKTLMKTSPARLRGSSAGLFDRSSRKQQSVANAHHAFNAQSVRC
jgi:hypothetical protein